MKPDITVSENGDLNFIREAISSLNNAKVYVGIPEAETTRKGGHITNAALMFIHTNGSELMHLPKRPVIEPSIEANDNKERIAQTLEAAASAELDGNKPRVKQLLQIAGMQGANAAKRWFTDSRNQWPRNKSATIARKLRRLKGAAKSNAMNILNAAGETGDVSGIDTPLIDEGELRRSITHVEEYK